MEKDYDYLFKIILIGNSGVGKTCLIKRFTDKDYQPSYISTIGVDFKIKTVEIDSSTVKLQIWDTAGQERFRTITNSYYRGAHGIIVVFDLTDADSFKGVRNWVDEIKVHASENVEVVLIGNKIDLTDDIVIKEDEIKALEKELDVKNIFHMKTSAKENIDVENMFLKVAKRLCDREKVEGPIIKKNKAPFRFDQDNGDSKKAGCC